jgi:hypothetical protein
MKRFAIVAALAVLSSVGCKKKDDTKVAPEATEPATKPAEAEKTPAPADPAAAPAAQAVAPAAADPAAAAADPAAAAADMNTGITECDDLIKRYNACEKLPAEQKSAFMETAKAWKQGASTGDEKVKASITDSCKTTATSTDAALKASGC